MFLYNFLKRLTLCNASANLETNEHLSQKEKDCPFKGVKEGIVEIRSIEAARKTSIPSPPMMKRHGSMV